MSEEVYDQATKEGKTEAYVKNLRRIMSQPLLDQKIRQKMATGKTRDQAIKSIAESYGCE